ncbi:histone H3-K9 methyltransferase [Artemisia annua]|uniref:Histone H3-K9 methyltransferase n=1 Tax=Artemisia annua TaxID=35608 RepID=A0A2U1Q9A2_ARTAN|nr:histone H3-K9 methyltransferase [Artemisia annua]
MVINGITSPIGDNGFAVQVKWKPRSVSAVRDFPPGCGPIVQLVVDNGVNDGGTQGAQVVDNGVDDGGTQGAEVVESLPSLQNGDYQAALLKEVVSTQGMENGGSGVKEDMQNGNKQAVEVSDVKVLPINEMENGGGSVKEDMQNGDKQAVEVSDVKVLPMNEMESGGIVAEEGMQKLKFPRRRVSAVRDFPPYCGPNAAEPTEEERKRINGSSYVGLTEDMVVDGEASNKGGISSNETQNEESNMNVEDFKVHVIDEPCQELVVYTNDNAVSRETPLHDDDKHSSDDDDADIQEMLNRSIALVQNDIKDVAGQKLGHEKRLHKRPLDDDSRHLVIGLQVSDDEEDHRNDFEGQMMFINRAMNVAGQKPGHEKRLHKRPLDDDSRHLVIGLQVSDDEEDHRNDFEGQMMVGKNIGSQKVAHDASQKKQKVSHDKRIFQRPLDIRPRPLVVGLQAPSLCAQGSVKLELTSVDDSIKAKATESASVTPKVLVKKKHKKQVKDVGESSGAEKAAVTYTGTLEMVVRKEQNIVVKPKDTLFNSYGPGPLVFDVTLPPFGPRSSSDARYKVRETLRRYHAICRKLIQCEESESVDFMAGYQKKRIDLAAKAEMEKKGLLMDLGPKECGPVEGVEVGDEFQYRVELALVGIHRPFQGGIDSVKKGKDFFAVSIVASGGYDNEIDKPDCLIYSGAGGITKEKTVEDQKLEKGNLALYNNIATKLPVRVVRGYKSSETLDSDSKSKLMTTYIYDGLYMVNDYKRETGPKGNLVFKFELTRIPGQPELAIREVKSKKFKTKREGVCAKDISDGKESFRICAINTIDDDPPPSFTYITKIIYPDWYRPVLPKGCACVGRCSDKKCECAFKNGGEIPYNHNGAIVEVKPLVYECGPSCGCPPSCYNRVTQHGIKLKLEIFKTESRGWGVRSLSSISSGSFICEYIGELLEDTEAEKRTGNDEYLFDIGQKCSDSLYPDGAAGEMVDKTGFTIDALQYGNVGRFINHSCSPNLYAQDVLYDQEDKRMPHIMLFAAENIPPLQELTYDYNYAVNTVHDADGNIKIKNCYCGSSECTGRLY